MTARVLMLQGTASSVGKSVVVTALCRIFADDGLRVAPFKAQNMSNNSYVTPDGLELGRAQAEQARAARVECDVRMNPVLLKPEGDRRSQVVLMGLPSGSLEAGSFDTRGRLWPAARAALDSLRDDYDLVIVEGAGSPAEVNLRKGDIVNMRVARHAKAPVLLVGDVDNGGVFAHLVGTLALLKKAERKLVRGFVINKFRGNLALLQPGLDYLEKRTKRPVLGVLPYLHDLQIADEDAVSVERRRVAPDRAGLIDVAVVALPRISNFDDFNPLETEPGVRLRYVSSAADLAGADLAILPGTKNTRADLRWLRQTGIDAAVCHAREAGARVLGVCGGFQMLGEAVIDDLGVEGAAGREAGLGLLPVSTRFNPDKVTRRVSGRVQAAGLGAEGAAVEGYEIHMAESESTCSPLFEIDGDGGPRAEGAVSPDGRVFGTYIHGLFANDVLRRGLLAQLGVGAEDAPDWDPETSIDRLAAQTREHLDIDAIRHIAGL